MSTSSPGSGETSTTQRQKLSLDQGWLFHSGDIPFPVVSGHQETYNNAKAGNAGGAAAITYDDSDWRGVDLPHDWAVEQPFDPKANLSQGYRERGYGWYRRHFQLDPADRGKHLELQFDGIVSHATVWVNGTEVQHNFCGYTGFNIDLTPFARYGDDLNTIAVRVDAVTQEGWWYEGAGIYRHTWLIKAAPVHVMTDGVFAQPVRGADGQWTIPAQVTLGNDGQDTTAAVVEMTLQDARGQVVAQASGQGTVAALDTTEVDLSLPVANPHLWSLTDPYLYTVKTVVKINGQAVDAGTTHCGFRTLRFDADKGFFLNDQPVKIQGTCNHQDHAGVGVAVADSLWDFRVRRLKEMGSNAYRCAHNPPAAEFLDACDRLGMLVMDENRHFSSAPDYMEQLRWMVRRDRNHPCVFLWSVFNEEPMQGTETGYEMVRRMAAAVRKLDTSRPVTAAMNGGFFAPVNVSAAVDVVGFNYSPGEYDAFHKAHPQLPMMSSEDTSSFMTRGEYVTDAARNIIGSYDDQRAPWGETHREAWKAIATRPFVAGGFIWTGFDYRGEPTPHQWPSAGSFFGCLDLCGFPKMAFYLHQAQWIKDRPVLQIVPHWNWPGAEGKPVKVMVLSNADTVDLSLNGKSVGEKAVDPFEMVSWDVPYAPGRLEAVAKKAGKEIARASVETTGVPVALQLAPDRTSIAGDGWDAVPVTVEAVDDHGRVVPTADTLVKFSVNDAGNIIGLGNGDENGHEAEKGSRHSLFNGLGQVILQSRALASGPLTLVATADGLKSATLTLDVKAAPTPPFVPAADVRLHLERWRMSPVSATKIDPNVGLADSDMNSWVTVRPGELQDFKDGTWAVFRSEEFKPFKAQTKAGGQITFRSITGRAEVWLDGPKIAEKTDEAAAPLAVPLPAGDSKHTLSVLIEAGPNEKAGLGDRVVVEPKS